MYRTDVDRLIDQILLEEPLISESRKPQLKNLIESKYTLPLIDLRYRAHRETNGKLRTKVWSIQGTQSPSFAIDQLCFQQKRRQIYYWILR